MVVLGGGHGARYARGRELILQGQSSRLLVINPSDAKRQDALKTLRGRDVRPPRNGYEIGLKFGQT